LQQFDKMANSSNPSDHIIQDIKKKLKNLNVNLLFYYIISFAPQMITTYKCNTYMMNT